MASVFLYHVVGDLTVGKPELVEFAETETVEAAIRAIGESTEGGITVWKKRSHKSVIENADSRQHRFVGILNFLDIVAFLAKDESLDDHEKALKTPVSELVAPDASLLKEVDPGTRLIDALEMMKQGVKRLLVPKSIGRRIVSKRFSVLYNGKWLKNIDTSNANLANSTTGNIPPSCSTAIIRDKFCCLSREDVIRFLIGCLGALAPLPLTSISSLGAINPNYSCIDASSPAIDAMRKIPHDPCAVAVVESISDGLNIIIGEISAYKLWKCDYLSAAWALAKLSAGQFVMGVEDNMTSRSVSDLSPSSMASDLTASAKKASSPRLKEFRSRSVGYYSNGKNLGVSRSVYRGRSAPLICKTTSSLAAVMAQMLSHRATHVWVIEAENEDNLVGVVGYADVLAAVTRHPPPVSSAGESQTGYYT